VNVSGCPNTTISATESPRLSSTPRRAFRNCASSHRAPCSDTRRTFRTRCRLAGDTTCGRWSPASQLHGRHSRSQPRARRHERRDAALGSQLSGKPLRGHLPPDGDRRGARRSASLPHRRDAEAENGAEKGHDRQRGLSTLPEGPFPVEQEDRGGIRRGIDLFEQAIEKDPSFAAPYAGIADAYVTLATNVPLPPKETMPKARRLAEKAIELDPNLAEGTRRSLRCSGGTTGTVHARRWNSGRLST